MDEAIWITREGQRIPVTEMTDSHLQNTLAMLRRIEPDFPSFQGEEAQASAESEWFSMLGHTLDWIEVLENEQKRRKKMLRAREGNKK